jgi:hypothetical protein
MSGLRDVMSEISLDDIQVAPYGRVHIANPDVAARISALKASAATQPTNGSACNGSQCNRRLE